MLGKELLLVDGKKPISVTFRVNWETLSIEDYPEHIYINVTYCGEPTGQTIAFRPFVTEVTIESPFTTVEHGVATPPEMVDTIYIYENVDFSPVQTDFIKNEYGDYAPGDISKDSSAEIDMISYSHYL